LSALQNHINANGGVVTNRDYYQFLTEEDAACAFCHTEIINPHGFGMEDFDPVGLPRIEDSNGLTIDANGSLVGVETLDDGQVETFTGGRGLSDLVQSLDATKSCFAQKGLRFVLATGHEVFDGDNQAGPELTDEQKTSFNCALDTMTGAMTDSNDNPLAAFRALGMDDVVRFRK